jgi:hypothetical protein
MTDFDHTEKLSGLRPWPVCGHVARALELVAA